MPKILRKNLPYLQVFLPIMTWWLDIMQTPTYQLAYRITFIVIFLSFKSLAQIPGKLPQIRNLKNRCQI